MHHSELDNKKQSYSLKEKCKTHKISLTSIPNGVIFNILVVMCL